MNTTSRRRIAFGQAIIVAIATGFWFAARNPVAATAVVDGLASRFEFKKFVLPAAEHHSTVNYTTVNPALRNIATWMSSVGAAVASFDFDGDGLANDICMADPRSRDVRVVPA